MFEIGGCDRMGTTLISALYCKIINTAHNTRNRWKVQSYKVDRKRVCYCKRIRQDNGRKKHLAGEGMQHGTRHSQES